MKKTLLLISVILGLSSIFYGCSSKTNQYIKKGNDLMESGKFGDALTHFEEAIRKSPKSSEAYLGKALALEKQGKNQDCIQFADKAIAIKPKLAGAYDIKGSALANLGKPEQALTLYEKAISLEPTNGTYYSNKAFILNILKRYQDAIVFCDKAIKSNPDLDMAYNNKAFALDALGKYIEAEKLYSKSIELNPRNEIAYYNKGNSLKSLRKYEKSIDCFDNALRLNPNNLKTYLEKGKVLILAEKHEEALKCFDKALTIDPKSSLAIMQKGSALYYLKKYDEAIKLLDQSIQLDSANSDAYVHKAKVYTQKSETKNALDLCNKALSINQDSAFAYDMIGYIYSSQYHYTKALEAFDKAISKDPGFEDAYIDKLYTLYYQKNYARCIEFASNSMTRFPNSVDFAWTAGDCYSEQYESEKAIEQYNKVLEINATNETVLTRIGQEYYHLQDYQKASSFIDKALKINPENQSAKYMNDLLKETKHPDGQRIVNFIKDNYLYLNEIKDFDKLSRMVNNKTNLSNTDIEKYVESIKKKNDLFTYVVRDKDYDTLKNMEDSSRVTTKKFDQNIFYIKIDSFTNSVGYKFREAVYGIKDPQKTVLIIDLRNNTGGLIGPSNDILDLMLPKCTTSYTIYRDGYIDSYDSDAENIQFKKVFIFVNEWSASSSEILSLGLKKYLNNVVIVGRPTLGKGVGQIVYENKANKYMIFLVSFYWNVKEQNISGSRIYPDIPVKNDNDSDYFNVVYNHIK